MKKEYDGNEYIKDEIVELRRKVAELSAFISAHKHDIHGKPYIKVNTPIRHLWDLW